MSIIYNFLLRRKVMFCQKCGKQIDDDAVICIGCGCTVKKEGVKTYPDKRVAAENDGLAKSAFIMAFLIPIAGLIMGIIGETKYSNPEYKKKSTSAIFISIAMWIVYAVIIGVAMYI